LRPVAAARPEDVERVSQDLLHFSRQDEHFRHSPPALIQGQREQMLQRCAEFARDYGLRLGV
jgi:hypothetical protein